MTLEFRKKFEGGTRLKTTYTELVSKSVRPQKLSRMLQNERMDGQKPNIK